MRVLIVEDIDEMRELIAHLLSQIAGVSAVAKAANLAEAHQEVFRRRPDLVLLDEILPGESGLDLLPLCQASRVRVILMTESQGHLSQKVPSGAEARITKPSWETSNQDLIRLSLALRVGP